MNRAYVVLNGKKFYLTESQENKPDNASKDPGGDPRYSIPSGVTGGGEGEGSHQDVRQLLQSIHEMLKTILSRLDSNMPWITRAGQQDGGN